MRVCKQCGKNYNNYYSKRNGYKFTINTEFCSKSCATKFQRGSLTKELIESEIVDLILFKNSYCGKQEILDEIHRSSKTLSKFGISISKIQENLGYTKPKSVFQEQIYTQLKKYFNNIYCEKQFTNLLSPKGYKLLVDFYIESHNLIIEADGTQHTDRNNSWFSEYCFKCDRIKDSFAKESGINLIRIPYVKKVTDKYILKYIGTLI